MVACGTASTLYSRTYVPLMADYGTARILFSPMKAVGQDTAQPGKKTMPQQQTAPLINSLPSKVFLLLSEFWMLERAGPLPAFRALIVVWVHTTSSG